jgi:hypothetical protein
MKTWQVIAVVTVVAIIALALGTTLGYGISSGKTTTLTTTQTAPKETITQLATTTKTQTITTQYGPSSLLSANYSYICTEKSSNLTVTLSEPNDTYSGCQTVIPYWYLYYLYSGASGSSNQNGTISIQIGSGACIGESFVLWNGSKVSVQIGQIGNTTCE